MGQIIYAGQDISTLTPNRRVHHRNATTSFIFQFFNVISLLTVEENVQMSAIFARNVKHGEAGKRTQEILKDLKIYSRRAHYPDTLSGGEKQRLAIAMALIKDSELILADEPTGELDRENTENIIALFHDLHTKYPRVTFIIVTHNLTWCEIADRVLELKNGKTYKITTRRESEIKGKSTIG